MKSILRPLVAGCLMTLAACASDPIAEFKADTDGRETRDSRLGARALAECMRPHLEKTTTAGASTPELRLHAFEDRWEAWRLQATNGSRTVYLTEFEPRGDNGSTARLYYARQFQHIDALRANFNEGMAACQG